MSALVAWSHALVVSSILALAALLLDQAVGDRFGGRRWIWFGAMALVTLVVASIPFRLAGPAAVTAPVVRAPGAGASTPWMTIPLASIGAFGGRIAAEWPARLGPLVGPAWLLAALALLGWLVVAYLGARRRIDRLPVVAIHGRMVRVSPRLGPLAFGIRRGEVVVPRHLLGVGRATLESILVHEESHRRAGDPALLVLASALRALLAPLPALWWMHARLRLAIECDCDRRVLGSGRIAISDYGRHLIDAAQRIGSRARLAPGFTHPRSDLERRLLAMTRFPSRRRAALALPVLAVAGFAVLVACAGDLPTTPVTRAEPAPVELELQQVVPDHVVDGSQVTAGITEVVLDSFAIRPDRSVTGEPVGIVDLVEVPMRNAQVRLDARNVSGRRVADLEATVREVPLELHLRQATGTQRVIADTIEVQTAKPRAVHSQIVDTVAYTPIREVRLTGVEITDTIGRP